MNVKIVFVPRIFNDRVFESIPSPPLAIYLLASLSEANGFSTSIIDPCEFKKFEYSDNIIELCAKYVIDMLSDIDVLAFSANSFNWGITKEITGHIYNAYPDLPIIAGGLHPTIFDAHILQTSKVKYILRGAGERSFVQLLKALNNHSKLDAVENLSYMNNGILVRTAEGAKITKYELTSSPYPSYALIPNDNTYIDLPIESSRGCPYCCCFCSIPDRRNWIGLDTEVVIERIKEAVNKSKYLKYRNHILFVDDCFTIDFERTIAIFNRIKEEFNNSLKVHIEVRITDIIKNNLFSLIPTDLIYGIQIGVECGYDEGLKLVNKQLTLSQLYEVLPILSRDDLVNKIMLSFIIGFPWETKKEIQKTLNTIEFISGKFGLFCNINWMFLLPSAIWNEAGKYNINVDESIFDDPLWCNSEELFFKLHPKITAETVEWVTNWCENAVTEGLHIAYSVPYTSFRQYHEL